MLSKNTNAFPDQTHSQFEEVYALFTDSKNFTSQLKEEQQRYPAICSCMKQLSAGTSALHGHLKRVQKQLRIQEGLLSKSGRPVIPPPLIKLIITKCPNIAHFGLEMVYSLLQARCYWPNM